MEFRAVGTAEGDIRVLAIRTLLIPRSEDFYTDRIV
jgi:hypothetical protein